MYERFYNLRERPFSLSPDPDYLYRSRVHREALGCLQYGIEGYAGFVLLTGNIGCGKTTLLQTVLRELDRPTSVSWLVNTMLDARELIEAVMLDFGMSPQPGMSKPHLLRELGRFLYQQRTADRLALLIIDEAQNLSLGALEEVRMLSNLETEKSKLLHIVLVGQPSLRDLMARPEMEQLRQRVTVSYHLHPLAEDETAAYVNHRLRCAAIGDPLVFPGDVTDLMHVHSGGVPRKLNIIGDAILLFGYGEDRRTIDVDFVQDVLDELRSTGIISSPQTPEPSSLMNQMAAAAGPAPMSSAAAATTILTASDVAVREARLTEREKQLAEQQRLLFEGYRLLREEGERGFFQHTPAGASPRQPSSQTFDIRAQARAIEQPASSAGKATRFATEERGPEPAGLWARLRRSLTGSPKIILED
jgi:general secretion pathway protein A